MDTARKKAADAALFKAIRAKKLADVKAALSAGADVNAKKTVGGYPKIRPFHLAIVVGSTAIIDLLLTSKADLEAADEDGNTPLHYACGAMRRDELDVDLVKVLLERGAKADARSNGNISPLHEAIASGRPDIAELLIARGADLRVVTSRGTLMSAACAGDYTTNADNPHTTGEMFKFLRAKGLPLDDPPGFDIQKETVTPPSGFSLLHIAAQSANLEVVKLLLSEGVPVNAVHNGKTPLDYALEGQYGAVARALEAAKATKGKERG
jgi:ankyrin repeat protein